MQSGFFDKWTALVACLLLMRYGFRGPHWPMHEFLGSSVAFHDAVLTWVRSLEVATNTHIHPTVAKYGPVFFGVVCASAATSMRAVGGAAGVACWQDAGKQNGSYNGLVSVCCCFVALPGECNNRDCSVSNPLDV